MTDFITAADLYQPAGAIPADIPAERINAMMTDAIAKAVQIAPCILKPEFAADEWKMAALKAILRTAITRWHESGSGALTSYSVGAGPYSQSESFDTRQPRRQMFWPTEIEDLAHLCIPDAGDAYMFDMTGLPTRWNPLAYAVINANPGREPMGTWSDEAPPHVGQV